MNATEHAARLRIRLNSLQLDLDSATFLWEDSDRQDEEARNAIRATKRAIRKAEFELTALAVADGAR